MSTREAIMNAVSHAHAGFLSVRLSFDVSTVMVSVCDDGIGFDPSEVQLRESDHFGLSGMRERMRKVRGSVTVDSERGKGTKIYLSLPLSQARILVKQ